MQLIHSSILRNQLRTIVPNLTHPLGLNACVAMLSSYLLISSSAEPSMAEQSPPIHGPAAVAYDFRSDTVTVPTPEMFSVMAKAPLGDDVLKEDPSVNALESHVAKLLGKPAALFVTSGTLSNQLAIRAHLILNGGGPPYSLLVDSRAHVHQWEAGGIPAHTGAMVIAMEIEREYSLGLRQKTHLTANDIKKHMIPAGDDHCAPTRLVCLENTLNGAIMPIDEIKRIATIAHNEGISVHMDGARLWNACAASGLSPRSFVEPIDSVSVCLSKGIGAPIGSVLAGSNALIARARHLRKMYGGGWRQAGLLASAAQHALDKVFPHELIRTHSQAQKLAKGLVAHGAKLANIPDRVETNIVYVDWAPLGWTCDNIAAAADKDAFHSRNEGKAPIRVFGGSSTVMRLVLHYQLAHDAVDRFLALVDDLKQSNDK